MDNSALDGLSDKVREEIYDTSRGMCFRLRVVCILTEVASYSYKVKR